MPVSDILYKPIDELARLIQARQLSPVEETFCKVQVGRLGVFAIGIQ
jgi:hypothetical protein